MAGTGPHRLVMLATAAGLTVAAFAGGLLELISRWSTQEEYSHGFFLPAISLWMLWLRRAAIRDSLGRPSGYGLLGLLGAVSLLLLGELSAIYVLEQYGFVLALMSLLLCTGGFPLLRVCRFPLLLLLFAIPLPHFVDAQLSWRLQLMSSGLGVEILRALNISVYLEGNVIDLGAFRLQVVEACSGLRYLYPLLSLGVLLAYLLRSPAWQRVLLVLSCVPITVLMNSLRIALVGLLVQQQGAVMAEGFLHYFEGWLIFVACLLLLLALIWLLERFGEGRPVLETLGLPMIQGAGRGVSPPVSRHPLTYALVVLTATLLAVNLLDRRQEEQPDRLSLASFPLQLADWQGQEGALPADIESALGLDDYVIADYRKGHDLVNFYAAYYASQRKGVSPHSPQVCIPGGGWQISDLSRQGIELGHGQMEVNRVIITRGQQRQLVYYWFEQRGRRIANEYSMKWYLLRDALLRNRTDGALVRLTTPIATTEDAQSADLRLQAFLLQALPELPRHIPN